MWLKQIAQGNERAFRRLYDAFARPLHGFLFGILTNGDDVEEVFQEVMLAIWTNGASRYRGGQPASFVFGIAYRKALRFKRGQRNLRSIDSGDVGDLVDNRDRPEEDLIRRDLVKQALDRLPAEERGILVLSFVHKVTYKDIGEIYDMPEGTVKRKMSEIRSRMREFGKIS